MATARATFAGFSFTGLAHQGTVTVPAPTMARILRAGAVRAWRDPDPADATSGRELGNLGRLIDECGRGTAPHRRIRYRPDEHAVQLAVFSACTYTILEAADPYLRAVEALGTGERAALALRLLGTPQASSPELVCALRRQITATTAAKAA